MKKEDELSISQLRMRLDQLKNRHIPEKKESIFKRLFRRKQALPPEPKPVMGGPGWSERIQQIFSRIKLPKLPVRPKAKKKQQEIDVAKIFRSQVHKAKARPTASERKRRLAEHMEKAGIEFDPARLPQIMSGLGAIITAVAISAWLFKAYSVNDSLLHMLFISFLIATIGFFIALISCWIVFFIFVDVRMYQRKLSIEEVLPDYLQLTSANIRAGMPIDRALWFAVRPKFGVLAKEIEDVAKRTLSGEDLNKSLMDFGRKYDSPTLQRSINLLIEGTEAGGDIGDLLNKIADNISELRAMRKEMSASVMTYAIFITFASIVAAPVLFALSEQLLVIIQQIGQNVGDSGAGVSTYGLSFNLGADTIKQSDFRLFIYITLGISSFFSAVIIATIRKGDVKEGIQYIPIFIIIAMIIFTIASQLMGWLFSSFVVL